VPTIPGVPIPPKAERDQLTREEVQGMVADWARRAHELAMDESARTQDRKNMATALGIAIDKWVVVQRADSPTAVVLRASPEERQALARRLWGLVSASEAAAGDRPP
jgi:hypothetical protein